MERDVKARRPYEGAARQARTRRTRTAVVEAARSLFHERGYAATTIEAISDRSDTPQATVYRLFSSKLGILRCLLDISIGGDDQAVAMVDRPEVRALLSDPDPKNQLTGFAALVRDVMVRVGPVHGILADAARSDQDAASLLAGDRPTAPRGPAPHRPFDRSGGRLAPRAQRARGRGHHPRASRLPRCTGCWSSTGAGATFVTRTG